MANNMTSDAKMYADAIARELAKAIWITPRDENDDTLAIITQALKQYGNARLEDAAQKLTTTIMSNKGTLTEVHTEIRNLKEPV